MSLAHDLLRTANEMVNPNQGSVTDAHIRPSISTAYYSVFHALAHTCADCFVGQEVEAKSPAWAQVYRALEHGFAKDAGKRARNMRFSPQIIDLADFFVDLQDHRHQADYDPVAEVTWSDGVFAVRNAALAIHKLETAPGPDRTAFAALVLLKKRA